jgi:hypothetical protein
MRHCSPIPSLLTAAALLLVAALPARAQVPLHEQDREWVNIAPDSLQDNSFGTPRVGYTPAGERVMYASAHYWSPSEDHSTVHLLKSTDDGKNWTPIYSKEIARRNGRSACNIGLMSLWAQNPNVLYAACDYSVLKSTDGGETWQNLTSQVRQADLSNEYGGVTDLNPARIEVSPFDSAKVFLASAESEAYALASDDGGQTWHGRRWVPIFAGHHGQAAANVAVSQRDSSRAYFWAFTAGGGRRLEFFYHAEDWGRSFNLVGGTWSTPPPH